MSSLRSLLMNINNSSKNGLWTEQLDMKILINLIIFRVPCTKF